MAASPQEQKDPSPEQAMVVQKVPFSPSFSGGEARQGKDENEEDGLGVEESSLKIAEDEVDELGREEMRDSEDMKEVKDDGGLEGRLLDYFNGIEEDREGRLLGQFFGTEDDEGGIPAETEDGGGLEGGQGGVFDDDEEGLIETAQQLESPMEQHVFPQEDEMVKGILSGKRKRDAVPASGMEDKEGAIMKRVRFADSEEECEGEKDDVATTIENTGSMESGGLSPKDLAEVVSATLQRKAVTRQDTPGPESGTMRALQEGLDDLKKDMEEVQKDRAHWRNKVTGLDLKLGELKKWKKAKEQDEMEQRAVAKQKIEEAVKSGTAKRMQEMKEKCEEKISTLEQKHKAKLKDVNAKHAEDLLGKEEKWKKFKEDLNAKHEALKEDLHERHEGNKKKLKQRLEMNSAELKKTKENFTEEKKRLRLEQQEAIKAAKPETNVAIKAKESELKQKDQSINQLEQKLEDSQAQISSLQHDNKILEEEKTRLSDQFSDSQTLIHTLQETNTNQTTLSRQQTEAFEREKVGFKETLAAAQAEFVETLDHERRSFRKQYDAAQEAKIAQKDLQRSNFALRTALEGRDRRLEGLREEMGVLSGKVEELEGRLVAEGRGEEIGRGEGLRDEGREVGDRIE
ncbi:hypothetical protein KC333_g8034 [Hortaea werneckii]|nr:hypothetical protein KC333_g8034 [Hortaea werneckii]KAI7304548.1 hypothetical protein KC326_g8408 [Hortaea werneckii]